MKKKTTRVGEKGMGARAHSPKAEGKYRAIRGGLSKTKFYLGEVRANALKTHLAKEYRNPAESEAFLKLTGYLQSLQKTRVWTATKEQSAKWFMEAESMRWDKKFGLSKEEAMTRFALGEQPKSIDLGSRPSDMIAKKGTPYKPKIGSSAGKIKTIQRGADAVQRDFAKMIRSIFAVGGNKPKTSVNRTFSKTFKK